MSKFVSSLATTFNNLFNYNNTNIIVIFDEHNKIWFSLSDIYKSLGYSKPNIEINRLDLDDKYIKTYGEIYNLLPKKYLNFTKPKNVQPHMKMTDETGIYMILTKSKKQLAKKFRDSLYQDIIPKLREQGEYKFNVTDRKKLSNLTQKLKLYQTEFKRTQKQSYPDKTGNGFIYVLKVNTTHNGQNKVCHKIGYTANLEKRMSTYKTGNPDVELVHQENIKCNKKQLEKCVLNLNTLKLLKNRTEVICDSPLKTILEEIKECQNLLDKFTSK
jgi:prophage antirepressor-like protein